MEITLKKLFLSISPKISRFQQKFRYFVIILKKSFFVHISENINIWEMSIKRPYFKITFKNSCVAISPEMFFAHISEYINIREMTRNWRFFRSLLKIVVYSYLRKYQHFEQNDVFSRSFWKASFLSIYP